MTSSQNLLNFMDHRLFSTGDRVVRIGLAANRQSSAFEANGWNQFGY